MWSLDRLGEDFESFSPLQESTRNQQEKSSKMKNSNRQSKSPLLLPNCSPKYCLLAVIILIVSWSPWSASAEQSGNNQLVSHHGSSQANNPMMMFKDLSGPTSGKIQTLDVICGKNFMTVRAEFSGPFYGIVFSKGTYGQENCIYVKPNSGLTHTAFNVYYEQCGTKPDLQGKFYENTIVIQYGSDIIEAYDEAKRLRCEWFEAYEKPATFKPAIPVADLEVVEMNFQGDDIDCWMEIQEGAGPTSREVSKIVSVGQPMTIVVAINDYNGVFDMRVKSCVAHDGVQQPIALTDEFGCVLRPKMLTPFVKVRNPQSDRNATILSYSRFLAFKFPDSMTVQIQCTVEVCRHGCADACQRIPSIAATTLQPELSLTAKWPASPNQAAIQGPQARPPKPEMYASSPEYRPPSRVVPQPAFENRQQFVSKPNLYHEAASNSMSTDEMNGSETSNQLNHVAAPLAQSPPQPANNPPSNTQRRSQDSGAFLYDGKIPQYLMPISAVGRRLTRPQQQPAQTTTTTTASPTIMTTIASSSSTQAATTQEGNRASGEDITEQPYSEDSSINRLAAAVDQTNKVANSPESVVIEPAVIQDQSPSVQDSNQSSQDQGDNKAEASNPKPSIVMPDGSDQKSGQAQDKPSVQGNEETSVDNKQPDQVPSNSDSSLKTVEVEIPANLEESVRPFSQPKYGDENVDNNSNNNYKEQNIIQPREPQSSIGKRDKNDDSASIESMVMGSGKSRFGTRQSQLPSTANQQLVSHHLASPSNHQMPPSASGSDLTAAVDSKEPSSVSFLSSADGAPNNDKVLVDRSDDSSSLTDLTFPSSSSSLNNESPHKDDESASVISNMDDSSSYSDSTSSSGSNSGRAKPVVGTEELASGPLQIEDRIGAPAPTQESLEEALNRLQQQIQPQQAALVSEKSTGQQHDSESKANSQKTTGPAYGNGSETSKVDSTDRVDSATSQSKKQAVQQQPAQPKSSVGISGTNQPYPNVVGQAKVIPDPTSSLLTRGAAMSAQASNESPSIILPAKQPFPGQPMAEQKPVAQITNIPMGFAQQPPQQQQMAPQTLPTIQQITQQLAYFQQQQSKLQQQQQQQQQQQLQQVSSTTTSKPSVRSRLSLLSPQAALQAVASRFLSKSTPTPAQPAQQQSILQQLPQYGINLSPEQQKMLQSQQQQQALNRFPIQQQTVQPPPAQPSVGLFGRLTKHQPLIRSRRSAMMPNGNKGSGEVGIAKTFMVVTNMDLAFSPNLTNENELPQILEGKRLMFQDDGDEVIYGVCMPVVSLTFVLTCAFWLVVFIISFCIYMLIKSRKQQREGSMYNEKQ